MLPLSWSLIGAAGCGPPDRVGAVDRYDHASSPAKPPLVQPVPHPPQSPDFQTGPEREGGIGRVLEGGSEGEGGE